MKFIQGMLIPLFLLSFQAIALERPKGGELDSRIKFIDYNPNEVVDIVVHYGYSTDIQFGEDELIDKIALGDKSAWSVGPVQNHLFLKAAKEKADTNMTVITNKRVYTFELSAHWSRNGAHPKPNDMFFKVNFNYPEEEKKKQGKQALAKLLASKLTISKKPSEENKNYWAKGSPELTPNKAFDDKRFTYLTFANNKEMPAIYVVNSDGSESLVNTNIDPNDKDTIIIHKIAKQFVLRKGHAVVCVFNKSYDVNGISNHTGTTSSTVRRVIKEVE